MTEETVWLTWLIFVATYAGLAVGKVPGLRVDRAGIALVGATLVLVTGILRLEQATSAQSLDFKTLFLLFGMMIVMGVLRLSGFFERLVETASERIARPKALLALTIGLSGVLSAFLINDVVCIALTPLVLHLARRLRCDPLPHLLGLATAANVGSTGTITGNPQNIYIGAHSGISYVRFASRLLPVAVLGLGLTYLVICLVYGRRLTTAGQPAQSSTVAGGGKHAPAAPPAAVAPPPPLPSHGAACTRGCRSRPWSSRWRRSCCSLRDSLWNWSRWEPPRSSFSAGSNRRRSIIRSTGACW